MQLLGTAFQSWKLFYDKYYIQQYVLCMLLEKCLQTNLASTDDRKYLVQGIGSL
jgi:hypothetical protein